MNSYQSINAIRMLGVDAINQANSGHPGIVLGAAPMAYTIFTKHLNVNVKQPNWFNRDRFILSAGHGSMLLYALLHVSGFAVSLEDIKRFRQIGNTPGHPEYGHTEGVETTSGPLGQGISNAVGMAIAEAHLASHFNKPGLDIVNHHTYVICGDGDLQEGVALESISLAGRLGLGKLIVLFDSNDIQLDGPVDLAYHVNHKAFFEAQNWQHLTVADGEDIESIHQAIQKAKKMTAKPTIIEVKTVIGKGSNHQGTSKVHGSPLGSEDRKHVAQALQWQEDPFVIPNDVYQDYQIHVQDRGLDAYKKWQRKLKKYQKAYPDMFDQYQAFQQDIKVDEKDLLELVKVNTKEATRSIGGKVLDALSKKYANIIGGSADLTSSTKAKGLDGNFLPGHYEGRNINYGVREHAMAAINNGIVLHGGLKAFSGAFFVFSDYMKPSIRLSALMQIPSIYVFTHDSIAVGEDGPTHQPIEQLVGLRSIPNLNVYRPADGNETVAAWKYALESKTVPTAIVLTRQNVYQFEQTSVEGALKGAYIVSKEQHTLEGILLATGSEVELAIDVQKQLLSEGIDVRVVSMPSMFLFEKQTKKYQREVLPKVKTIAIEMASPFSWYKYTQHVFGIDRFGVSAKDTVALEMFGFTKEKLSEYCKKILK